jgi:hypothetical protein
MLSSRGLACPWPNRIRRLVDGLFRKLTKPIFARSCRTRALDPDATEKRRSPHAHCRFSRPKFSTGVAMGLVQAAHVGEPRRILPRHQNPNQVLSMNGNEASQRRVVLISGVASRTYHISSAPRFASA